MACIKLKSGTTDLKLNSILVIGISIVLFSLFQRYWEEENKILVYDALFYYSYIPGILEHEDASFEFLANTEKNISRKYLVKESPNGIKVPKATYGVALFELPFYTIADQFAKFKNYKSNSFSSPYRLAILIACNFYLIIGIYFLRKVLLKYFSKYAVEISVIVIVLGTNLFTYVTYVPGMSHGYSFFCACIYLYSIDKWQSVEKTKYLYLSCFFLGLLILLRPTNASFGFFLLFFSFRSIKENFQLIKRKFKFYAAGIIFMILPLIPQMVYWKLHTGNLLFYTYGEEKFFWNDPKVLEGLFSFRKGWLVYSPLMLLSLTGIFVNNQIIKNNRIVILLFLLINVYITFSWWCWWYGGSFGQRPMIDFYPILALPLVAILEKMFQRNKVLKAFSLSIISSFCALSLFQNYQYQVGLIHHNAMSKSSYKMIFLKTEKPEGYNNTLIPPMPNKAMKGLR